MIVRLIAAGRQREETIFMVELSDYYALRHRNKAKIVSTDRTYVNTLVLHKKAKSHSFRFDFRQEKEQFLFHLKLAHGEKPAAVLRARAGLTDTWLEGRQPLRVRDIKRTWKKETSPDMAPLLNHSAALQSCLDNTSGIIGMASRIGAPLNSVTLQEYFRLFPEIIVNHPGFQSGDPANSLTVEEIKSTPANIIRNLYRARHDYLKYSLLTMLPHDVQTLIGRLMNMMRNPWVSYSDYN